MSDLIPFLYCTDQELHFITERPGCCAGCSLMHVFWIQARGRTLCFNCYREAHYETQHPSVA